MATATRTTRRGFRRVAVKDNPKVLAAVEAIVKTFDTDVTYLGIRPCSYIGPNMPGDGDGALILEVYATTVHGLFTIWPDGRWR